MIKSKAWDWKKATAPWWKEPASEIYPLLNRWEKQKFIRLLDLGCGIGRHSIFFAENGFEVSAFDLSKEGIEELNNLIKQHNLPIKTIVGDMLSLPYENEYFDCLIAYHAIYHTDDKGIEKVIKEIYRILKKDGEAFITFNTKNGTSFKDPDNKRLTESTLYKTKGHEKGIPHFYADKKQVEELLKDFEILEFSYKEEYYPDYVGTHYFVLAKKK